MRVREHLGEFRTAHVAHDPDLSWMRLTVDVPEDLARVARLLDSLPASPPPDLAAVIAAFERDPALQDQSGLPLRNERYRAQRDAAHRSMTAPAAPVAHGRRVFRNTLFTGAVGVFSLLANFFVIGVAGRKLGMRPIWRAHARAGILGVGRLSQHLPTSASSPGLRASSPTPTDAGSANASARW